MENLISAANRHCKHTVNWPTAEQIMSGAMACPFCYIEATRLAFQKTLSDLTASQQEVYDKVLNERGSFAEQAHRLMKSNVALRSLAIELCDTTEKIARLRKIVEVVEIVQ